MRYAVRLQGFFREELTFQPIIVPRRNHCRQRLVSQEREGGIRLRFLGNSFWRSLAKYRSMHWFAEYRFGHILLEHEFLHWFFEPGFFRQRVRLIDRNFFRLLVSLRFGSHLRRLRFLFMNVFQLRNRLVILLLSDCQGGTSFVQFFESFYIRRSG